MSDPCASVSAFQQARQIIWHPRDFHLRAGHIEIAGHDETAFASGWQNLFSN